MNIMQLKDIYLKNTYDSDCDDILNEFYVPVLSSSTNYERLAGFFSSTSLAVSAKGISEFITNNGHMRLICGAKLSNPDLEIIKDAYECPENIIEKAFIDDIKNMEDEFVRDHVRALGWMIANGRLEIKVAIVCDDSGYPLDEKIIERQGIFHQKVGIIEDSQGNKISFSGSANESASGWLENIEEFKVFRSWIDIEKEYLNSDENRFRKFWSGETIRTKVIDVSMAIKEELIKIAPKDIEELNLNKWLKRRTEEKNVIRLYEYQEQAVRNWIDNRNKGIFEMATGTGKTYPALECIKIISKNEKKLITVIVCPSDHIIKQVWKESIKKYGISFHTIISDSSNIGWKDELTDYLYDIKNDVKEKLIILTTYLTFSSEDFINIIRIPRGQLFLIADEVHWAGAPKIQKGLIEEYFYRLGLSATPKRWFDDEGTDKLFEYFGGIVFEFPFEDAINKINPATGLTFLAQYEYRPYFVELTEDEFMEYERETKKIARLYSQAKGDKEKSQFIPLLNSNRQKIIKNAHNKYKALNKILDEIGQRIRHCLVYVLPEQMDNVQDIFLERNIIQHKFTMRENTIPEDRYGGLSERGFLLKQFEDEIYAALIAMKCLDEAIDIPSARIAILMANSGNPREHIQRTGRVLRNYPGKENAIIYDIIVIPPISSICEISALEKKILIKEMSRYKEFTYNAINRCQCLETIGKIEERYRIFIPIGDSYE